MHEIDRRLFEHAGADRRLDSRPVARLDDDRVDAGEMQHLAQQKAGRPGADDSNLRALRHDRLPLHFMTGML